MDVIADDWNYWLAEPMGVQLRPDLDQIPAIADKRRILWDMADKATDLTLNERRAMKGYKPVAGGDEILVASSQISLGMAVNPPDLPQDLTAADVKAWVYGTQAN